MIDQSDWPTHLRDDAPYKQCDTCLRKSWSTETRVGTPCEMPQPDGRACEGHFREPSDDLVRTITAIVRMADKSFEADGGSSRHWVRDHFLPLLHAAGLEVRKASEEA